MASAALVATAAAAAAGGDAAPPPAMSTARSRREDGAVVEHDRQHRDAARQLIACAQNLVITQQQQQQQHPNQHQQQSPKTNNMNAPQPDPVSVWSVLHQKLLSPQLHFAIHRICYETVYSNNHPRDGATPGLDNETIKPSWIPPKTTSNGSSSTNAGATSATAALDKPRTTHAEQQMQELGFSSYHELYEWSVQHKNDFWMRAAEKVGIQWMQPPKCALSEADVIAGNPTKEIQYYPGAMLNIAESCLKGKDDDIAIVYANDTDPCDLQYMTVRDLRSTSYRVAHRIQTIWQFPPGTAIAICLPMIPESLAVYLGIVLAGCVVVSIADSFSAQEVAARCHAAHAQAIFTQDVIVRSGKALPLYERVVQANRLVREMSVDEAAGEQQQRDEKECKSEDDAIENPEFTMKVVVLPAALHTGPYNNSKDKSNSTHHPAGNHRHFPWELHESIQLRPNLDWSWHEFLNSAAESDDEAVIQAFCPVPRQSMDACNILFSSGTTGNAKAIVWHHVTPIKCVVDGYYHQDIGPTDRVSWPTNMGWMMGPWLLYQRINGAAICLYQGLPHTPEFCKFVEKAGVTMLGVIPSLVKQWQARNSCRDADWSRIRRFSSTGEASDPVNYLWLQSRVPGYAPVIEYCGGTEVGGSFLSSTMAHANVPSMFATPCLGSEIRLLEAATGRVLPESEYRPRRSDGQDSSTITTVMASGELVLLPPSIGLSTRLLHRSHFDCYYKDMPTYNNGQTLRRHGDEMQVVHSPGAATPYFRALGRVDDTMNLGGIKVSSVEIERVCNAVDVVKETAAIAVSTGGPCQLVVYAVLIVPENEVNSKELQKAMQLSIKEGLNPLFGISDVVIKDALPRTASNKIMRRLLRDEYLRNMIAD